MRNLLNSIKIGILFSLLVNAVLPVIQEIQDIS